jgi:hypothetical protein
MRTNDLWKRHGPLLLAAAACVAAGLGLVVLETRPLASPSPVAEAPAPRAAPALASVAAPPAASAVLQAAPASGPPAPPPPTEGGGYRVDLVRLREQLPHNRYWRDAAPTQDPELLREREEETRRWNTLFGKVQANEATEAEVREYYAYRRQLSEDYIALSQQILESAGAQLPEQERGLHELNIQLHRARLAELPAQEQDALARREAQERRREAWLRAGGGGP